MSSAISATTPFPNRLLDEAMPHLKDTEWRVLCVIVRQTLGWGLKDGKGRKKNDWLTQAQLVRKTGRDRAALSRAVDALVQRELIEVRNEHGNPLHTPKARRQCRGRLIYALHHRVLPERTSGDSPFKNVSIESEYRTPSSNSLWNTNVAKSEYHPAPKANTTKETLTKEIVTKAASENSLMDLTFEVFDEDASDTHQYSIQGLRSDAAYQYSDAGQQFIALFKQLCERIKGQGANVTLSAVDAERLEKLLIAHPSLDWTPILESFFGSDLDYIARKDYALRAFLGTCNIFLMRRSHVFRRRPR